MNSNVELIAPAGSLEKLRLAYRMGADACYIGTSAYSMRTRQNKIREADLVKAKEIAREMGKKLFVCVNIFPRNNLLKGLKRHLQFLKELKPDAIVFADPSLLVMAEELDIDVPFHLSVQTSTSNHLSVKFWSKLGVKRIILARELTLKEIGEIKKAVPAMELEAFVHGSVCMAYSGRCFLSAIFSNRDANQGICAHNCRDDFDVLSATVKDRNFGEQEMRIEEDEHGSHLMSSKDMLLLPHIGKLIETGIRGFKIEGRNKSDYYLAVAVRTYRKAIDLYCENKTFDPSLLKEIEKTNNRGFFSGFYFPELDEESEEGKKNINTVTKEFYKAKITAVNGKELTLEVKGKIIVGDSLRLLTEKFGDEVLLKTVRLINSKGEETNKISSGVTATVELEEKAKVEWAGLLLQADALNI